MKKSFVVAFALFSATAFANQSENKSTEQLQFVNQPMLQLEVYDLSNKVASVVKGRKFSISNKSHELCWIAYNMPFGTENQIKEMFTAPKKTKFNDPGASILVSNDGKQHTIIRKVASINNEFIRRCWRFDKRDPLGKYSVEISVNDAIFPAQTFELVK